MCRPQLLAAERSGGLCRHAWKMWSQWPGRRAKRWESAARVEPVKLALQLDPARSTGPCKDMERFCRAVANTRHHGARAADVELAILMDPGGLRGTRGTRGSLLSTRLGGIKRVALMDARILRLRTVRSLIERRV